MRDRCSECLALCLHPHINQSPPSACFSKRTHLLHPRLIETQATGIARVFVRADGHPIGSSPTTTMEEGTKGDDKAEAREIAREILAMVRPMTHARPVSLSLFALMWGESIGPTS